MTKDNESTSIHHVSEEVIQRHLGRYGHLLMEAMKDRQSNAYQEALNNGTLLTLLLQQEEAMTTAVIQEIRNLEANETPLKNPNSFMERATRNIRLQAQAEEIVLATFLPETLPAE
jgi:hypothetical protein